MRIANTVFVTRPAVRMAATVCGLVRSETATAVNPPAISITVSMSSVASFKPDFQKGVLMSP